MNFDVDQSAACSELRTLDTILLITCDCDARVLLALGASIARHFAASKRPKRIPTTKIEIL